MLQFEDKTVFQFEDPVHVETEPFDYGCQDSPEPFEKEEFEHIDYESKETELCRGRGQIGEQSC